ncbi:hypothetical protein ONZ43_g5917 [Nemania bipapillata]|uniref:Uncharacterized protein n=1 Tax=Nemania bipapillata TaxID=110536 RepID=A0ACC2I530_9PEZI|nr:hypothetical protein ONZ43_g5917 [Nemania bipapillata]
MSANDNANNGKDSNGSRVSTHDSNHDSKPADATITAKTKARGLELLAYSQRQLDRIVNPTTRQNAVDSTIAFASRRPMLSLFVAVQLVLALLPLLLFGTFVLSTVVLATLTAIVFVLFWMGVALLFLVPTLFFTSGLAVLLWLWAVSTYVTTRALYNRLPASVRARASADKQVIFPREGGHDFDLDSAIHAEAAEMRE